MKYEYKCIKCGVIEVDQRMVDDALDVCPKCGNTDDFHRIVSGGGGFVLDGSGWASSGYEKVEVDY